MSDDRVIESSGNVFADLGFEDPEEELLKARLSHQLRAMLAERGLTAQTAAEALGLDRKDIASIVEGRTGDYSIEHLVRSLDRLDHRVDVVIRRKSQRPTAAA